MPHKSAPGKWHLLTENKQYAIENKQCAIESKQYAIENKQCAIESKQYAIENKQCAIESKHPQKEATTRYEEKRTLRLRT